MARLACVVLCALLCDLRADCAETPRQLDAHPGKTDRIRYTIPHERQTRQVSQQDPVQHSYQINAPQESAYPAPDRNAAKPAYPVRTPEESAYPQGHSRPAYPVNVPVESAYPSKPAYPVNVPTLNAKPAAYPVNTPSESAYPTRSPPSVPYDSAYGKPSVYGDRPYGAKPQGSAYEVNTPPQTTQRARTSAAPDAIPFLLIKKDNSIYATGALPDALKDIEDDCEQSETLVNNKPVCKGQLLFHDDFDILNPKIWKNDIRIPKKPDYEFVSYIQSKSNSYVENGHLILRTTLLSDLSQKDLVRHGKLKLDDCASAADSGSCFKEVDKYNILPPVLAARLRTQNTFSFQYGRVDVKARMPSGDWVYPEIWLEPAETTYGRWYMSGRVVVAMARGNAVLAGPAQESMGVQQLSAGCLYRKNANLEVNYNKYLSKISDEWTSQFHNYSVRWTPDSMEFYVDGESIGVCTGPNSQNKQVPWKRGTSLAPFDKPFYITLGIGAGGISEFPDHIKNGAEGILKPWKNVGAKALLSFYEDQNNWSSTWDSNTALTVDSVSVYAL